MGVNVEFAEEDLGDVHPNTVSYRLRKLGHRLERDLTRFSDLVEVLTWSRVLHA